ncbi:hypothetical protein N866_18035 [Actinotalea ferrariae CF5-4]|uniref:Uncharacterized protein n=1 Tax=Actinotalea ferrariae CF5-4 TaxID=948458 RepID=A0A021VXK8_9CELL|nr:hypothetical protein [Actinotalea ferrariae]EYR63827.1 hypothetical protein N866_18035 [Actinotalea ferrariae CF5-4]
MHPSLLYDVAVREHEEQLALHARRHETALATRDRADRPTGRRTAPPARTVLRRVHRSIRRTSAPAGAPAQRPAATARPAADGHALAA